MSKKLVVGFVKISIEPVLVALIVEETLAPFRPTAEEIWH